MSMCSYMEQMHVHDCQCMLSECDREHSTTKDTEVMTLKYTHALHNNCESG